MPTFKYADLPAVQASPGMTRRQVHTDHMMVVIVDFEGTGASAPLHQHPHEQISYIVEGKIHFTLGEGEEQRVDLVEPGDAIVVPPNVPHSVKVLTESARLIDCFHPIRQDFL
jgi:quercetin dioxygenase-like cupin family protein